MPLLPYVPFASFEIVGEEVHSSRVYVDPPPVIIPDPPSSMFVRIRPIMPYPFTAQVWNIGFWPNDLSANLYIPGTAGALNWNDIANAFDGDNVTIATFTDETQLFNQWITAQITAPTALLAFDQVSFTGTDYTISLQAGFVDLSPDGIVWTPDRMFITAAGVNSPSSGDTYFPLLPLETDDYQAWLWAIEITESNHPDEVRVGKLEFMTEPGPVNVTGDGYGWADRCPPLGSYPDEAFDNYSSSYWAPAVTGVNTGLLMYFFPGPRPISCIAITAHSGFGGGARAPKSFRVLASLNGIDWIEKAVFTDITGWTDGQRRQWCWIE